MGSARAEAITAPRRVVLDMDSTEIKVHGLLFNREGDCLAAKLRPGNVHKRGRLGGTGGGW